MTTAAITRKPVNRFKLGNSMNTLMESERTETSIVRAPVQRQWGKSEKDNFDRLKKKRTVTI